MISATIKPTFITAWSMSSSAAKLVGFTHPDSYHKVPESMSARLSDKKLCKLNRLNPKHELTALQKSERRAARQLSVRQQNTKFKAGTLPISVYRNKIECVPFQFNISEVPEEVGQTS